MKAKPEGTNFINKDWMEKKEATLEARRTHMKKVCEKLNLKDHTLKATEHFWFDIRHGFTFCDIPKVWLNNIFWYICTMVVPLKLSRISYGLNLPQKFTIGLKTD